MSCSPCDGAVCLSFSDSRTDIMWPGAVGFPMREKHRQEFDEIDRLIRSGEMLAARRVVLGLCRRRLPRAEIADTAMLCLRAGLPMAGARLLKGLIRPSGRKRMDATDKERAYYALSLIKLGAVDEGIQ